MCAQPREPLWEAEARLLSPSQTQSQVCSADGMMPKAALSEPASGQGQREAATES